MKRNSLRKLCVDELNDLYSAEAQLVKALGQWTAAAQSFALRASSAAQLRQGRGHVTRLRQIFRILGESPTGWRSKVAAVLVNEGNNAIFKPQGEGLDVQLIRAARRIESYGITAYESAYTYATLLGEDEVAWLLRQTLKEKRETSARFSTLAQAVSLAVMEQEDDSLAEKFFAGTQKEWQETTSYELGSQLRAKLVSVSGRGFLGPHNENRFEISHGSARKLALRRSALACRVSQREPLTEFPALV